MTTMFKDYRAAHDAAVDLARLLKRDVGLWKGDNPIDGKCFIIRSLPKPENRYGDELRCQVVSPQMTYMDEICDIVRGCSPPANHPSGQSPWRNPSAYVDSIFGRRLYRS